MPFTTKYRDGLSTPPLGSDELPIADVSHGISAVNGFAIPPVSVCPPRMFWLRGPAPLPYPPAAYPPARVRYLHVAQHKGLNLGAHCRPHQFLVRRALPSKLPANSPTFEDELPPPSRDACPLGRAFSRIPCTTDASCWALEKPMSASVSLELPALPLSSVILAGPALYTGCRRKIYQSLAVLLPRVCQA